MANQFIDKVNAAFSDGMNNVNGIKAVLKFYDDYGKMMDDNAKNHTSEKTQGQER